MIEVPATQPGLPALFDPEIPNNAMLFATLLGHTPGRAWVDDPEKPSKCMVRIHGLLIFLSKNADQAFLDEGLETIKLFSHAALVWRQGASTLRIPPADRILERLAFAQWNPDSPSFADLLKGGLSDGLEIRAMDKELVKKAESREEIESYCGSVDNFLAHGFGVCLAQNGEIISEAYSPFVTSRNAEIGILTKEAQRGHGYAAITCAHFIQACQERGLEPYWSCDADNQASINLARKLGFREEYTYQIQMYRGTPQ